MLSTFSRRDFLKASGAGLLGGFLADLRLDRVLAAIAPQQGRSTMSGSELFGKPSFKAKRIRVFGRDEVMDIRGEVHGDQGYGNPFNATWYQVYGGGFVYSGAIQPVETIHQKPVFDIPETGVLGEITVPYSDTRRDSSVFADRGYRVYYSTTHWITRTVVNRLEKSIWYEIYDRQTKQSLYVPSHEMRVISPAELTSLSPGVPEEEKRIYVDLANQLVAAFEGENPAWVARCASGARGTETPLDEFRTYHKGPSVHMTNQGNGSENTYHLPGVPQLCSWSRQASLPTGGILISQACWWSCRMCPVSLLLMQATVLPWSKS